MCRFGMFTSITFNLYVNRRIYNRLLSSGVYIKLFISIDMTVRKIGNIIFILFVKQFYLPISALFNILV